MKCLLPSRCQSSSEDICLPIPCTRKLIGMHTGIPNKIQTGLQEPQLWWDCGSDMSLPFWQKDQVLTFNHSQWGTTKLNSPLAPIRSSVVNIIVKTLYCREVFSTWKTWEKATEVIHIVSASTHAWLPTHHYGHPPPHWRTCRNDEPTVTYHKYPIYIANLGLIMVIDGMGRDKCVMTRGHHYKNL